MQKAAILNLPFSLNLPKVFWPALLVLIIFLSVLYIFQINAVISEGYLIKNYQDELTGLTQENKILEISSVQNNSLENAKNKVEELGFENIAKIHYIQIIQPSVVSKLGR